MNEVLVGRGLAKRFGQTVALAGVDLTVHAAEAVAIMGPSGSGKSTLLHCLAGIMKPDAGEVHLLGQRIDDLGERRRSALRRTRFGFVFQFGQLLPELPAEENVALPLMLGGVSRQDAVRTARQWFGPLGLGGMERRRPGELSGGQAQRVAIARALVTKPAVVFADEPTGALDQATGHDTMRLLVEATKHNGASLIVVTHDPGVAGWCDRTVEVRDGRLLTGGVSGGVPVGMSGGVPGWVPDGRSGGTFGGVPGGTSGGVAGGTSGGVEGGMTGGVSA
ncbi:MAG TPA: ABC transporter ATP-binding protein [Nonomuraea sp.]|nr:ABC transporter ATP-binding protein [Nonomuraea sp.]